MLRGHSRALGQPSPVTGVVYGISSKIRLDWAVQPCRSSAKTIKPRAERLQVAAKFGDGLRLVLKANRYISTNDRGTRSEARAKAALMQASISSVSNVLRMSNGSIHHWLSTSRLIVLSSNR